jgi:hypothetical protein
MRERGYLNILITKCGSAKNFVYQATQQLGFSKKKIITDDP